MRVLLLSSGLFFLALAAIRDDPLAKKAHGVQLNPNEIKRVKELHYGWYTQAVSALLGAMGKEIYMKMNRKNRKAFVACLDSIDNEHDLKMGAQCLVKAFDGELLASFPEAEFSPQYDFVGKEMPATRFTPSPAKRLKYREGMRKIIRKRVIKTLFPKEEKIEKKDTVFTMKHEREKRPAFKLNKKPLKGLSKFKGPKRISMSAEQQISWQRRRVKRNVLSLYTNNEAKTEAKLLDKLDSPWKVKSMSKAPFLGKIKEDKTPAKAITELLGGVVRLVKNRTTEEQTSIHETYKKLKELQDLVSNKNREGQFKHRMLDMVIGKNHPLRKPKSFTDRFRDIAPAGVVDKSVYGLVDTVEKHTKDVNYNVLSPRFFPILPDKYSNKKPILSPNLFPFYKDDSPNSIMPIPELLEKTGMQKEDRTNVLELIMDASGVKDVVDDALQLVKNLKASGMGKDILDITAAIADSFSKLQESFTKKQKKDITNKKFIFMNKIQLTHLYGEKGIYNNTVIDLPFDIDKYSAMDSKTREESLKEAVRHIAGDKRRRHKRTLKFATLMPTVLAPFSFAPAFNTFSTLGPLVISPNIFSPSVTSPLFMSLPVISPQVGDPLILSPYFLGPNVLSAAVFNAYVLSPYVLSPNVVNPYVLSPLILSPFVLCPDVLSPTILSGAVLSPAVASPSIFTESALAAAVLSPTVFS